MPKTVSVSAQMGSRFAVTTDIRGHKLVIDQPQAGGGQNEGPTPLEFFLFSLGGCVATIARIVAQQQKIELRSMQVQVDADLDAKGLLGQPTDNRVGFTEVRICAQIDADLSDQEKAEFLDLVCERCPLHDNVKLATQVVHQLS
jgi:uncharacterized OsmC-like protein